jgi:hypothetical protein
MDGQKLIDQIKRSLAEVKQSGQSSVTVEAFEQYLNALGPAMEKSQEIDVKLAEYAHERNLAHYDAVHAHNREMLRAVIAYGQATLKSTILINGGAAAALLAFIGNVWDSSLSSATVSGLTNSVLLFSSGVLAAAFGTAFTYCTQYCYAEGWKKRGIVFHIVTVLLVLLAFSLFGYGTHEAYLGFFDHLNRQ